MKPRPVLVIWDDACVSLTGENLKPERTRTLGWMVKHGRSELVIATDWCEGMAQHGETRHTIPMGMVVDWWWLDIE